MGATASIRIEREILGYLVEHPSAKDTLEGIVEWWLMEQKIRTATVEVKSALAALSAREFIIVTKRSDGRACYQLNRAKEEECRQWLMDGGLDQISERGSEF